MKKRLIITTLLLTIFLLTGCESNNEEKSSSYTKINKVESNGEIINTKKMKQLHCKREVTAPNNNMDVNIEYDVFYTDNYMNLLHSSERVSSPDKETLNTYEEAYKKIFVNYENFDYYDATIERGETSLKTDIVINYDKVDIERIIAYEGNEYDIYKDGKALLDKWKAFGRKVGIKCEEVE